MRIESFALGDFETNCYVLRDGTGPSCLVIDPGYEAGALVEFLREEKLTPARILLSHGHCDHIAGIGLLREHFGSIPVGIGREDGPMLTDPDQNLSSLMGLPIAFSPADELYDAGDSIQAGNLSLTVLPTPGHTAGGISFYAPASEAVFTGDALFAGTIGRHDFPGGNLQKLLFHIHKQLLSLPETTRVYPGHGPATSIGLEKNSNPFLIKV